MKTEIKNVLKSNPSLQEIDVYCTKCRERETIQNPEIIDIHDGKKALIGTCPMCKGGMFRLLKKSLIQEKVKAN